MKKLHLAILIGLSLSKIADAENYSCKFSVPGAESSSLFNGSTPISGIKLDGHEFVVFANTAKFKDSAEEIKSIAIRIFNRNGITTLAMAPMGSTFIAAIDQTSGIQVFCRQKT